MTEPSPPTPQPEPVDAEIVPDPAPAPAPVVPDPGPAPVLPPPDYDQRGVPSFDHVRSKIEGRFATSLGATELAEDTPEGRTLADQEAEREKAAKAKLDEIRRSLGG